MPRISLLALILMFAFSAGVEAAEPCRHSVKPGHGIGPVQLGMSVGELRKVGTLKGLGERKLSLALADGAELGIELDGSQRVAHIQIESARVCLDSRSESLVDMKAPGADVRSPLPDCGVFASQFLSSWQCPESGVEFFWQGETSGAGVFRATAMAPFLTAPPPEPEPPAPTRHCEKNEEGKMRCEEIPPADPCEGNHAPMPEVACGFFGRDEQLAIHCYLTDYCMGAFVGAGAARIEVRSEAGVLAGSMGPWHDGRAMRLRLHPTPRPGAKYRVIVDGGLSVAPPATSLPNPAVSTDEASATTGGVPLAVRVRNLVGGRRLPGGYALDLQVPRSAFSKPGGAQQGQK